MSEDNHTELCPWRPMYLTEIKLPRKETSTRIVEGISNSLVTNSDSFISDLIPGKVTDYIRNATYGSRQRPRNSKKKHKMPIC